MRENQSSPLVLLIRALHLIQTGSFDLEGHSLEVQVVSGSGSQIQRTEPLRKLEPDAGSSMPPALYFCLDTNPLYQCPEQSLNITINIRAPQTTIAAVQSFPELGMQAYSVVTPPSPKKSTQMAKHSSRECSPSPARTQKRPVHGSFSFEWSLQQAGIRPIDILETNSKRPIVRIFYVIALAPPFIKEQLGNPEYHHKMRLNMIATNHRDFINPGEEVYSLLEWPKEHRPEEHLTLESGLKVSPRYAPVEILRELSNSVDRLDTKSVPPARFRKEIAVSGTPSLVLKSRAHDQTRKLFVDLLRAHQGSNYGITKRVLDVAVMTRVWGKPMILDVLGQGDLSGREFWRVLFIATRNSMEVRQLLAPPAGPPQAVPWPTIVESTVDYILFKCFMTCMLEHKVEDVEIQEWIRELSRELRLAEVQERTLMDFYRVLVNLYNGVADALEDPTRLHQAFSWKQEQVTEHFSYWHNKFTNSVDFHRPPYYPTQTNLFTRSSSTLQVTHSSGLIHTRDSFTNDISDSMARSTFAIIDENAVEAARGYAEEPARIEMDSARDEDPGLGQGTIEEPCSIEPVENEITYADLRKFTSCKLELHGKTYRGELSLTSYRLLWYPLIRGGIRRLPSFLRAHIQIPIQSISSWDHKRLGTRQHQLSIETKDFRMCAFLLEVEDDKDMSDFTHQLRRLHLPRNVKDLFAFTSFRASEEKLRTSPVASIPAYPKSAYSSPVNVEIKNDISPSIGPHTPISKSLSPSKTPPIGHGGMLGEEKECWPNKHYDPEAEFRRQGAIRNHSSNHIWELSDVNYNYEICSTYPALLVLPKASLFSKKQVKRVASFRSKNRIPTLTYYHKKNRVALLRSSQPMMGMGLMNMYQTTRCQDDEKLLEIVKVRTIMDARPKVSAFANSAVGGGFENILTYNSVEQLHFCYIQNIHTVSGSFKAIRDSIHSSCRDFQEKLSDVKTLAAEEDFFLSQFVSSKWLEHVRSILAASVKVVKILVEDKQSVLVHCSDGWDRTAQMCALAQIMMDPYYRTLKGFQVLIEKDWISFGHKFTVRLRHTNSKQSAEASPIFVQFLDCVWQIFRQNPLIFEFNEKYLPFIYEACYSCQFGTFIGNSEKERFENGYIQNSNSIWSVLSDAKFRNPYYEPSSDIVVPDFRLLSLKIWDYYTRVNQVRPSTTHVLQERALKLFQVSATNQYAWLQENLRRMEDKLQRKTEALKRALETNAKTKRKLKQAVSDLSNVKKNSLCFADTIIDPNIVHDSRTQRVAMSGPYEPISSEHSDVPAPMITVTQETPEHRPLRHVVEERSTEKRNSNSFSYDELGNLELEEPSEGFTPSQTKTWTTSI
jgi:hypothetical protein